jgi:hypothetical protein
MSFSRDFSLNMDLARVNNAGTSFTEKRATGMPT